MGKKYDNHHPDRIEPLVFHDMNCCPKCGNPGLVVLDHEFNITGIDKDGYISEVISSDISTEIRCPNCGYISTDFMLDKEGRIKICTEAERIYELGLRDRRVKERSKRLDVGLKSKDDNPFGNWEVTHF